MYSDIGTLYIASTTKGVPSYDHTPSYSLFPYPIILFLPLFSMLHLFAFYSLPQTQFSSQIEVPVPHTAFQNIAYAAQPSPALPSYNLHIHA